MKQLLRKLLGQTSTTINPTITPSSETPPATPNDATQIERAARDIGLDGWHNPKTGELIPGFPITAEDTVLDVGCGDADHSRYCLEHGAKVTFTDINPQVIEDVQRRFDAMNKGKAIGIVSDSYPLPIDDESMSRIIVTEVLEHVDNVVDLSNPDHPLLKAWATTWDELLKTPNPYKTIKALDRQLPKSQVILARKPG